MIELQNYSFSYDRKTQILSNINLKINQGEFVVITGLSGCGKTTLTRVLNGLCPNFYQGEVWGKYELYGKNVEVGVLHMPDQPLEKRDIVATQIGRAHV